MYGFRPDHRAEQINRVGFAKRNFIACRHLFSEEEVVVVGRDSSSFLARAGAGSPHRWKLCGVPLRYKREGVSALSVFLLTDERWSVCRFIGEI